MHMLYIIHIFYIMHIYIYTYRIHIVFVTHINTYELYIHLPTITSNSWVPRYMDFSPSHSLFGWKIQMATFVPALSRWKFGWFFVLFFFLFGISFVGVLRVIFPFHVLFLCFCLSVWNGFPVPRSGDFAHPMLLGYDMERISCYVYIYI